MVAAHCGVAYPSENAMIAAIVRSYRRQYPSMESSRGTMRRIRAPTGQTIAHADTRHALPAPRPRTAPDTTPPRPAPTDDNETRNQRRSARAPRSPTRPRRPARTRFPRLLQPPRAQAPSRDSPPEWSPDDLMTARHTSGLHVYA